MSNAHAYPAVSPVSLLLDRLVVGARFEEPGTGISVSVLSFGTEGKIGGMQIVLGRDGETEPHTIRLGEFLCAGYVFPPEPPEAPEVPKTTMPRPNPGQCHGLSGTEAHQFRGHMAHGKFRDNLLKGIAGLVYAAHGGSWLAGWYHNPESGDLLPISVPAELMKVVSELSEAMEGDRKDLMDTHLPHRPAVEVELADAVIRIANLAGCLGLDLGGAILEKMDYNGARPDHKPEARAAGGKRY